MRINIKPRPKPQKTSVEILVFKLKSCNQSDVARAIGYDQSQVSRAVNGKLVPSRDFGQALANHFGGTLDQLLAAIALIQKAAKKNTGQGRVARKDDKRLGPKKPKTPVETKKGK